MAKLQYSACLTGDDSPTGTLVTLSKIRSGPASEPTVSMFVVQRLLDAVEQAGVSRAAMARAMGCSVAGGDPDARMPHTEFDRVCELALELTGDPALGLHWAEALTQRTFVPVSYFIAHADSIRHALELLSRCQRLFCDRPIHAVIENERTGSVRMFDWLDCSDGARRFATEMVLAGFLTMIRAFHPGTRPIRVGFTHRPPSYAEEYERVFGASVCFNQTHSELVFERSLFDKPSPNSDADMRAAIGTVIERRLHSATRRTPYAARVRALIAKRMPARVNMPDVARAFGMSERSLRRQLAEEGTTYREIEYLELGSSAEHLLRDKQLTVQETAYTLGFSDVTTFHRAFKRWKGVTPSTFRNR